MSSLAVANNINEAYKIFQKYENEYLKAKNKFLMHMRTLFKYAEEKDKLNDIFRYLEKSEIYIRNIYIKSFIKYLMGIKLINKRSGNKLDKENAINHIKESADIGCGYAKQILDNDLFN
ncbi:9651_t:CDS:1 [Racocetra persica]|uniref:9651_t:CDS:1 n=1 Tax=Racocetra persica TaxID=160502 RepID=A0ACA9MIX3_9GLOM|nr:9651_t:CDS:1 [Racocetra persica]